MNYRHQSTRLSQPKLIDMFTRRRARQSIPRVAAMNIIAAAIAALGPFATAVAAEAVVLECGEYNFTLGIKVRAISSTLAPTPVLAEGAPCAAAVAFLIGKGFKLAAAFDSIAPFYQYSSVLRSYTFVSNSGQ